MALRQHLINQIPSFFYLPSALWSSPSALYLFLSFWFSSFFHSFPFLLPLLNAFLLPLFPCFLLCFPFFFSSPFSSLSTTSSSSFPPIFLLLYLLHFLYPCLPKPNPNHTLFISFHSALSLSLPVHSTSVLLIYPAFIFCSQHFTLPS